MIELVTGRSGLTPAELGEVLRRHILTHALIEVLGDQPRTAAEILEELPRRGPYGWGAAFRQSPQVVADALARFVALLSIARAEDGQRPFLHVEAHLWIRPRSRIVRSIRADSPPFGWHEGPPPEAETTLGGTPRESLPAIYCRHCGRSGWTAISPERDPAALIADPKKIYRAAVSDKRLVRAFIAATNREAAACGAGEPGAASVLVLEPDGRCVRPLNPSRDLGPRESGMGEAGDEHRGGGPSTARSAPRSGVWSSSSLGWPTEANFWTFRRMAARIERARAESGNHRYRHVVVDEAQDLSPAHWMLLRAMVAPGPNDMFLAGDTHQRIYDSYVSLGSLGIAIRGRSSRLTLSYRSTREILTVAQALLGGKSWDDLDGGTDTLDGYRSVLRGPRPWLHGYQTWADELDGILRLVREWTPVDGSPPSIGVAVPERRLMPEVETYLNEHGVLAAAIGADGPRKPDAVHVGTLHRFKRLEYQRMIVAGVSADSIPAARVEASRDTDPQRYDREIKQARSLLFVAATRARDALAISWHGRRSPLLPEVS